MLLKNAWEKVAESLDFAENGNFIRASSSNWEYFENTSEKKMVLCSVPEILTKYEQTNLIFANVILDVGRLTIQNSSSKQQLSFN